MPRPYCSCSNGAVLQRRAVSLQDQEPQRDTGNGRGGGAPFHAVLHKLHGDSGKGLRVTRCGRCFEQHDATLWASMGDTRSTSRVALTSH